MHALLWTLIKILVASLVTGIILNHYGFTPDDLVRYSGMTREQLEERARQAIAWALPNVMLGALVIVPLWFLIYLFRPPGRSSD